MSSDPVSLKVDQWMAELFDMPAENVPNNESISARDLRAWLVQHASDLRVSPVNEGSPADQSSDPVSLKALVKHWREKARAQAKSAVRHALDKNPGPLYNRAADAMTLSECADELEAALSGASPADPPLSKHAIDECNAAHAELDKLGVPQTRIVSNRAGDGKQIVTLGLVNRLRSLGMPSKGIVSPADPAPDTVRVIETHERTGVQREYEREASRSSSSEGWQYVEHGFISPPARGDGWLVEAMRASGLELERLYELAREANALPSSSAVTPHNRGRGDV